MTRQAVGHLGQRYGRVDLVAEERGGGFCAIKCKCKCYALGAQIAKSHLDSFISASAREPFTVRTVIASGDEWGRTPRRRSSH